ncbi:hypothetical protein P280DRAFT_367887, partial [Massarina eburnea CBS 473.64]
DVVMGQRPPVRTLVVALCLAYMFLLALGQAGLRYGRMNRRPTQFMEMLILVQFFVGVSYIASVALLEAGLGLATDRQCHVAIRTCIGMYSSGKIALYLFFIERVHVVRAPLVRRFRDRVWIIGVLMTVLGLGGITGYELVSPHAVLSHADGYCRIGVASDAAICIITMDTLIGTLLTAIFIGILRPSLRSTAIRPEAGMDRRRGSSIMPIIRQKKRSTEVSARQHLKVMLWRNIIGSCVILANTLINNIIFLTWKYAMRSHVCLLTCLTDIVVSIMVTNWLTMGS